ncbi:MAG: hypothetical protein QG653_296 [Patescibacteria group bacterium]|nr:hypothetical protein [Patescibacteria group bacterium]
MFNTSKNMREYQHKYIIHTLLYSPITIVILFLVIILLLRSVVDLNNKRINAAKLRDEAVLKQESTEKDLTRAEGRLSAIQTDRGFEEYVRTTYPVAKRGEGVVVVYEQEGSPVVPVREHMTLWEKLLIFIRTLIK